MASMTSTLRSIYIQYTLIDIVYIFSLKVDAIAPDIILQDSNCNDYSLTFPLASLTHAAVSNAQQKNLQIILV